MVDSARDCSAAVILLVPAAAAAFLATEAYLVALAFNSAGNSGSGLMSGADDPVRIADTSLAIAPSNES